MAIHEIASFLKVFPFIDPKLQVRQAKLPEVREYRTLIPLKSISRTLDQIGSMADVLDIARTGIG